MRPTLSVLAFSLLVAASPATAQTGGALVAKGPGVAAAAQTVEIVATITAIDAATRAVTLKGPQGNEMTLTAGPDVRTSRR
ncbi:MAG: hypothetical protein ABI585_14805 [Betaproteobacteria bacterium]